MTDLAPNSRPGPAAPGKFRGSSRKRLLVALSLCCIAWIAAGWSFYINPITWTASPAATAQNPVPSSGQPFRLTDPKRFDPVVVIPRQFPPITEFPVVSAVEAAAQLKPEELVIGVVVAGQSRAYTLNSLGGPTREILNDVLGGRAIAATW